MISETDEVAWSTERLLRKAGWNGRRLSWKAARAIAAVLMPTEGYVLRDNFAESLRKLGGPS